MTQVFPVCRCGTIAIPPAGSAGSHFRLFSHGFARALTQEFLCLGYSRAESLCKEYRQTKGPGTTAKPSEQLFFLKLGGLIKNTLEKCQRENGFM